MKVIVTSPEPDPEAGLAVTAPLLPMFSTREVHVTPGAAMTFTVPDTLPPAQPPAAPSVISGVTQSVSPLVNVAETDWFEFMVTLQAPVPEQAPPHPINVELAFATSLTSTAVPAGNDESEGNALIEPPPAPLVVRESV